MVLNGSASGGCDCYTLTNTGYQAGSIWSPSTIDLTNPFDFTFNVNLGASDGGADGIVFVLRQSGTSTGLDGSRLGYVGISNSIGIEIDTWNSSPAIAPGDIPDDHIGMSANGVVNHGLEPAVSIGNVEDGIFHDFNVLWDPTSFQLTVYFDGALIFTHTQDLVSTIFGGDPNVYFGWTGATGGASNIQQVCIELEAEFEIEDDLACPDQVIGIDDLSISGLNYNGVSITNYAWIFSGGGTSSLPEPNISFPTIGSKMIQLTVTNMIGCTDVIFHTLTVDSIDVSVSGEDLSCFGIGDGSVTALPETGDAPFSFLWDDPLAQTTATANDLDAGTYTVLVTDALGCTQTRSITIEEPEEFVFDSIDLTMATCGLDDGELLISASGGTMDYSYSINGGLSFGSSAIYSGLPDGTISIVVEDANSCSIDSIVVLNSEDLNVSISSTNITCFGDDDGTATATPEFSVGPCSFLWDDALGQTTATATNLSPGTYTVSVMHNALGCSGTATITVEEPALLELFELDTINPSCDLNNGVINIEAIGGSLPYNYSIDGGGSFLTGPSFTDLAPGFYSVIVMDDNGCVVDASANLVNFSNVPDVIVSLDNQEGCEDLYVNFINLSDPALTASTSWHLGDGSTITSESFGHLYTEPGCYDVFVEITTFDGCFTSKLFEDLVCVWEVPVADFSFTPENPSIFNLEVDFENTSIAGDSYSWTFGDGDSSLVMHPEHTYPEIGNVSYPVQLITLSEMGCSDTIVKYVTVKEIIQYYIPNSFTPNRDNINNTFYPIFAFGFIPADFHFIIYNRWGEVVWESYDFEAEWDGTYGDVLVEDGTYIWQLTFRENGSDKKYSDYGHVNVLK